MTGELNVSLFNYQDGGLRPDGSFDFANLLEAFADDPVPDLIGICEAKFWDRRGRTPLLAVLKQLSEQLGRPYVGELFTGPLGTAIIYDPTILCLEAGEEPDFPDKRNLARFSLRGAPDCLLYVFVEHWPPDDGDARLARARTLARYGPSSIPTLICGDLNSTSSGPHLPTITWKHLPPAIYDYRFRRLPNRADGAADWALDTRAVDRLIGAWHDPQHHWEEPARRHDSAGLHHLAELDPAACRPFPPTGEGGLHVDYLLGNTALLKTATVVPGSYRIHKPVRRHSDHLRISCTLALTTS